MKKYITLVLLALALVACDKKSDDGATEEPTADEAEATKEAPGDEAEEPTEEKAATVEVATDGTKFEPAISADTLPDGAWYCDMGGKVHYARMEKGDGKCAVCGMKLTQGADDDGHMMDDEQMGDGHMGDGDEMDEQMKDENAE